MRARGTGCLYRPTARDRRTGELRRGSILWMKYGCRGACGQPACTGVHRESTGFTDQERSKAERLLRGRLGEVDRGRLIAPVAEKTTFADLAAMLTTDYKVNGRRSLKRAAISLAHLREFFGPTTRAMAVTTDRITAYIESRQEAKAAPATVRNELAALKRMFTLGVQAGRVAHRPHVLSIEVRNTRTGFFERPDFDAVLAHLPAHLQPVAEFAYLTGWRKGEILGLTWRDVDFQAGEVRLEPGTTKNDEGRTFPFSVLPPLGDLLRRQRERTAVIEKTTGQVVPLVFHRRAGRPITDHYDAWRAACAAAGVPGRLLHDCRRTAVRNLERAGVPRSVAMKLTGHKTESVYRRYAIVSAGDLRAGVAKLAATLASEQRSPQQHVVVPLVPEQSRSVGRAGMSTGRRVR